MLNHHPAQGAILLCRYEPGFVAPEMIKIRPVVVITPRFRRRDGLCTVVPLSTTAPRPVELYHYELTFERPLPKPWSAPSAWVKADMFATVGFHRLMPIGIGKDRSGKRRYLDSRVAALDLVAIQRCVLHALDLSFLTGHLLELR